MVEKILQIVGASTYDFRCAANPADPFTSRFESWVPYYRMKAAIAAAIAPASILEIGVRFGYSAHAFLHGAPNATFTGVDLDVATFGGEPGAIDWARRILPEERTRLLVGDTQRMNRLPGARYGLVHIDGQQDGAGTFHDLLLALRQADYILVDGYFWSAENFQAVNEFLWKFRQDLEWGIVIPGYAGEFLIKTAGANAAPGAGGDDTSAAIQHLYTANYFLKDCGGWEFFEHAQHLSIADGRLRSLADLLCLRGAPGRFLDLGCGRGELALLAASLGARVDAVDYSRPAVDLLAGMIERQSEPIRSRIALHCADATTFSPDGLVDVVLAGDLVEHLAPAELDRLYENTARNLRPGGRFIVHTFPNRWFYDYAYPRQARAIKAAGGRGEVNPRSRFELLMHINEQSPRVLRRQLRNHFRHVLLWFGSPEDPAGSIRRRCSSHELSEFRDLYAIASDDPVDPAEILAAFAMADLPEFNIRIAPLQIPASSAPSATLLCRIRLANHTNTTLCSRGANPFALSYHWIDAAGMKVAGEGWRSVVVPALAPSCSADYTMIVVAPPAPGKYQLQLSPVQENRFWLSSVNPEACPLVSVDIR